MDSIDKLCKIILQWEGKYQCMVEDSGNYIDGILIGTNMGITPATYKQAFGKIPSPEDMKNLTIDQFKIILKKYYWNRWKADEIENESIRFILVDWVWASGKWGIIFPQQILDVVTDGIVGEHTINALNRCDQEELFKKIVFERIAFVSRIVKNKPSQMRFFKGWVNRIHSFKFNP